MSKKEFDDFLLKEEGKKKPLFDWEAEKKWWLGQVAKLYNDIQNWLKDYTDSNKIDIAFNEIDIYEEAVGTYTTQQMRITIFDQVVKLVPIGTILIGTKGRVDMTGNNGVIRLILADKNATGLKVVAKKEYFAEEKKKPAESTQKPKIDWVWKIASKPPHIKYTDLDQDTFLECLIEICNG